MTVEELAARTGAAVEDLRRWHQVGLLPGEAESFAPAEVARVELIRFALSRGYTADKLAELALVHGDMVGPFVESFGAHRGSPFAPSRRRLVVPVSKPRSSSGCGRQQACGSSGTPTNRTSRRSA